MAEGIIIGGAARRKNERASPEVSLKTPQSKQEPSTKKTASGTPEQSLQVWQQACLNCQNHGLPLEVLMIELEGKPTLAAIMVGYQINDSGNIEKVIA